MNTRIFTQNNYLCIIKKPMQIYVFFQNIQIKTFDNYHLNKSAGMISF